MKRSMIVWSLLCAAACLGLAPCRALAAEDDKEKHLQRLSNGDEAPPLDVAAWNDGESHKLADYRGKVVVLHFWGNWCAPCIETIPLWKRLQKKYEKQDVVFLGIHTAGVVREDVNEFLEQHDWPHLTAIDGGETRPDSATYRRYGVSAVNQAVVIDAAGRVAFNGRDFSYIGPKGPEGLQRIAKKLGVKSPLADDASEDEQRESFLEIFTYIYSTEIDAALKGEHDAKPVSDGKST